MLQTAPSGKTDFPGLSVGRCGERLGVAVGGVVGGCRSKREGGSKRQQGRPEPVKRGEERGRRRVGFPEPCYCGMVPCSPRGGSGESARHLWGPASQRDRILIVEDLDEFCPLRVAGRNVRTAPQILHSLPCSPTAFLSPSTLPRLTLPTPTLVPCEGELLPPPFLLSRRVPKRGQPPSQALNGSVRVIRT